MGAEEHGLTLEGLAHKLEALTEKLGGLERENERMRSENVTLQSKVATLEASGTSRNEIAEIKRGSETRLDVEPAPEFDGQVSRRSLLSKAGAAAVAAAVAGTFLHPREAKANHNGAGIFVEFVNTHSVYAKADSTRQSVGLTALWGETSSGSDAAVRAINLDSGPGVSGENNGTGPAVEGTANGSGGTGVKGTGRYGVWGESNQAGFHGVTGRNTNTDGTGVRGVGAKRGVLGESTNGTGVYGTSSSASLGAVEGHNNGGGTGVAGVGKVGMLAFSHTDGWIAMWGRHTGNGYGVAGDSDKGTGVSGKSNRGLGVYGETTTGTQGVFGRANGTGGQGVAGEASNGTGVRGNGRFGVVGASTGAGYGGQFQGGKAQLRIVPKGTVGRPTTGAHAKGEIYMDTAATLFVCTRGGTPGTWRRFATAVT